MYEYEGHSLVCWENEWKLSADVRRSSEDTLFNDESCLASFSNVQGSQSHACQPERRPHSLPSTFHYPRRKFSSEQYGTIGARGGGGTRCGRYAFGAGG